MTRALVLLTLVAIGCDPALPCDGAPHYQCVGGAVYAGGCGGNPLVAAQCAKGCSMEGAYTSLDGCPLRLCRENAPKKAGDPCQAPADCLPTPATRSNLAVTNTYLTCDAATQTCVTASPPVVADWLKPCDPALIAKMSADTVGLGTSIADPTCAEGRCALSWDVGASCVANACTRACTGDDQCPPGSTCEESTPVSCDAQSMGFCAPGGPAGIGFTCR